MSNIYNGTIKLNIFGTSHGSVVGAGIDGVEAGIKVDFDAIDKALKRRRPDANISNARIEDDDYEFLGGIYNGYTTGEEIVVIVKNKSFERSAYDSVARASHADFTNFIKSEGFADLSGGGARSGRLTAPLVILGSIVMQILNSKGISIESTLIAPRDEDLQRAINNNDSIGGIIKCSVLGLDAGFGEPFFDSIESVASHLLFSIPACKAVEFGEGVSFGKAFGSTVLDEFTSDGLKTNHNGGILGGVSNGSDINVTVTIKPTPTIMQEEVALDLEKMEPIKYTPHGRHDTCIAKRCGVIVESMMAFAILDIMAKRNSYKWMR